MNRAERRRMDRRERIAQKRERIPLVVMQRARRHAWDGRTWDEMPAMEGAAAS